MYGFGFADLRSHTFLNQSTSAVTSLRKPTCLRKNKRYSDPTVKDSGENNNFCLNVHQLSFLSAIVAATRSIIA